LGGLIHLLIILVGVVMKNLFLLFTVLFLFTSISFSQNFATKGTIEAGGSIGFSSTTAVYDGQSSSDALSTFTVQPYIGYFVLNSIELGIVPTFISQSLGDVSQSTFAIYFAPAFNFDLKSNLYPFIEGRIGYGTSSYDNGTVNSSASGMAWGLKGGVKVKIGNSSLFNVAVSYDQLTQTPENWNGDRVGENIFGVNAGFTVFFGH